MSAAFGRVYLLDLHSFYGLITDQVCLGNVNGSSSSEFLISTVESCFTTHDYQVVRNKTFTGGFITRNYSQMPNVEALQIEICYHVYLDESQLDKPQPPHWDVPQFYAANKKFQEIFTNIVKQLNAQSQI